MDSLDRSIDCVNFDKSRFRRYLGTIGEKIAQEVLLKEGFEVWLFASYHPFKLKNKLLRSGLIQFLSYLYEKKPDRDGLRKIRELKAFFGEDKLKAFKRYVEKLGIIGKVGIPGAARITLEQEDRDYELDRGYFVASDGEIQLKFIKHDENSEKHDYAYIYTPDFVAKKNEDVYVFEVKVNTGIQYFKGEKKEGFLLSKEYGFIPVLVTLNVDIKASNFKINEL